jgi:hypothetical protein
MSQVVPLSLAAVVVRSDGIIDAEVDNEIVALKMDSGTCYGLNRVGSRIWQLAAVSIRVADLCAKLETEYKVEPAVCKRQVLDLLEELRAEGLIEVREDPKLTGART